MNISDAEERRGRGFVSEGCAANDGGWGFLAFCFQVQLNCRLGMKM